MLRAATPLVGISNPSMAGMMAAVSEMIVHNAEAPPVGDHHLGDFFRALAAREA